MERDEIANALRAHIVERYAVPEGDPDFNDDVHLFDYGYVDSFGAVDLISYVQETFSVEVAQADLIAYSLNTVNEIASFTALRQRGEL